MMKKICVLILGILLLTGCKESIIDNYLDNQQKYEAYYQSILDNESFLQSSSYYSIEAVINQIDEYYRFSVIVDRPNIAMYDIEMMAVIDDGSVSINYDVVMPASGIFDRSYSMIPFQSNEAAGFPSGIILDGLCDKPNIKLLVMVSWKNADRDVVYKEFFQLDARLYPEPAETES